MGARLKKWFDNKHLSTTCDGDESVARGCALQCAMLAPFVKVRDFQVSDVSQYGVQLFWQPYSSSDNKSLPEIWNEDAKSHVVKAYTPIPTDKVISFKDKTEPFQVIAKYADEAKLPPDTVPFLGRWVVPSLPAATHPSNEGKPNKVSVAFSFDINGIFSVPSVTSIERYKVEVEEEVKVEIKPEDNATNMEVDSPPKEEQSEQDQTYEKPSQDENQGKAKDENMEPKTENAEQTKDKEQKDETVDEGKKKDDKSKEDAKPKYRYEKVKKMVKKNNKVDVAVSEENVVQMDNSSVQIWRKEELTMIKKDLEIQETNELRNSLEGYVLEMRSKLELELIEYIKDGPRQQFLKELNAMEDWLYEDSYEADKA